MSLFEGPSLEASLDELKAVYRILVSHSHEHPELERNAFFQSLHILLRSQAAEEGVNVDDDAEWEAWVAAEDNPPSEPTLLN